MSRGKKLLIALAIVWLLAIIGAIVYGVSQNVQKNTQVAQEEAAAHPLTITNYPEYKDRFEAFDESNIEDSLYKSIQKNSSNVDKTYDANIRERSYTSAKTSDGFPTYSVIVDIPAAQQSYKLSFEGDFTTDYRTVYILCPQPTELIYPAFDCKDQTTQ